MKISFIDVDVSLLSSTVVKVRVSTHILVNYTVSNVSHLDTIITNDIMR